VPHATLLHRLRETILAFMLPGDDEAMMLVAYGDVLRDPLRDAPLEGRAARLREILVGLLSPFAHKDDGLASRVARARGLDGAQKELLKLALLDLTSELTEQERRARAHDSEPQKPPRPDD
jgi:uncharacterized membrane protein